MGVPKFYRWISERYPKINEIVSDNALLPEFDHLYLDMNGIIHGCTHPSHMDVSDVISEKDMMLGIMHYLDRIITQIVKPKVSVYMAIDGVAPRAKLNQQRSRRFRSAKDMAEAAKDLPKDEHGKQAQVFDSNCITPGTEFLAKVSEHIRYFIRKKIKEDPLWHNLTVIFSGHDIPGEGEHKIMQHIREMRAQPNYQPNTRHCIYGQDADLIMLGLVTHEPHFTILREVINFNFNFRNENTLKQVKKFTKESDFQLLHLSILREYLQLDFCHGTDFDLERVIDDFVFMTFLVGNDFLPHMPTLDIGDGAFDLLFGIYKDQRTTWEPGQYMTESGIISDPARLEHFLAAIGNVETDILEQKEKDDAAYIKKRRKWDRRDGKPDGPSDAELKALEDDKQNDYLSMIEHVMRNHQPDDFVSGWKPVHEAGEKDFKGRYYFEKMKMTPVDIDEHWKLRKSYMEGLMWCLAYYYRGCISWGWFYPYHYGPMLSDLIDIAKMFEEINFEIGAPLTPFQQLMGCLPPASQDLVPPLYRPLMTSTDSPILKFYPQSFEVDMNGKKNPWEGVNLLPFIDIQLLKATIAERCPDSKLTEAERHRNATGKVYAYRYDNSCTGTVISPAKKIGLPDIANCNSSETLIEEQESGVSFEPKLVNGTQIPYPGFPSLNVLPIAQHELVRIGLNCFGTASKYATMVLSLHQMPEMPPLEVLAENVLGRSLFVNWPMMHEGKVVGISDESKLIRLDKSMKNRKTIEFSKAQQEIWATETDAMSQMYYVGNGTVGSGGVQIGDIRIRLKIQPLQGMRTNAQTGATKKLFGNEEADVPLQLALWQAPAPDPRFIERGALTLVERFPEGSRVVLTKGKYRGCSGSVVGVADGKNVAVKVAILPPELPFGLAIARSVTESFISSADAARMLKIHPGLLGKITGRLPFVGQGKYDLGLNLKSADGTCVVGYTRKKLEKEHSEKAKKAWETGDSLRVVGSAQTAGDDKEERIVWEYSPKAIRLVEAYRNAYPQLFTGLKKNPNEKKYDATLVFGPNGDAWLPVIRKWLDEHDSAKLPRAPVSSNSMSYEAISAVEKASGVRLLALKKKGYPKESTIKVPGVALYREGSTGATDILLASDLNGGKAPELGDRILNLCADGIPFGARGTVVAIHDSVTSGSVEVVMDEEFIGGSSLQGACSNYRGRLCVWAHLLKISTDENNGLIDKLVPKGAGNKGIKNLMSNINSQMNVSAQIMQSSYDSQADLADLHDTFIQVSDPANKTMPSHASNPTTEPRGATVAVTRAESTGRNKQGAWKEAKGPAEKGIGFKGLKKGKQSGLNRWKATLDGIHSNRNDVQSLEADLKAKLGLGSSPSNPKKDEEAQKAVLGVVSKPNAQDEAARLKAALGVGSTTPPQSGLPVPFPSSASDGLKAILGVQSAPVHDHTSTSNMTAADKLMQLMAKNQSTQTPMGAAPSAFNFTYVEHGNHQSQPFVPPHYQPQPPYGFPIGAVPPPYMQGPPIMMAPPPQFLPPGSFPHAIPTVGSLSAQDFPPLGGHPSPPTVSSPAQQPKVSSVDSYLTPSSVAVKKTTKN